MNDSRILFSTELVQIPGMTIEEFNREFDLMLLRNQIINKFINKVQTCNITKGEADEFYDLLVETGVEPYEWIDNSIENANFVINHDIPLED